ncbi:MAG: hypothetical protein ACRDN9_10745 [Streptosporangiaceae bacterium]
MFRRLFRKHGPRALGEERDIVHLSAFARGHGGVEGYVEPRTIVTDTTLVLVAGSGEWTRRPVSGPDAARSFGRRLGVPVYDVTVTGYPNRMRAWNRRRSGGKDASWSTD